MRVEKAIETLVGLAQSVTAGVDEEEKEAVRLGIEALKREQGRRSLVFSSLWGALPGETKD